MTPPVDAGQAFRRALRTWALYEGRRDLVQRALELLAERIARANNADSVCLHVTPGAILTRLDDAGDSGETADSVVYVAFRDGLRAMTLDPDIAAEELAQLIGILAGGRERHVNLLDDVVAQLWAARLPHVVVSAVDPYAEVEIEEEGPDAGGEADSGTAPDDERVAPASDEPTEETPRHVARSLAEHAARGVVSGHGRPGRLQGTLIERVERARGLWRGVDAAAFPPARFVPYEGWANDVDDIDAAWRQALDEHEQLRLATSIARIGRCLMAVPGGGLDALGLAVVRAWEERDFAAIGAVVDVVEGMSPSLRARWNAFVSAQNTGQDVAERGLVAWATEAPDLAVRWIRALDEHARLALAGSMHRRDARAVLGVVAERDVALASALLGPWIVGTPEQAGWAVTIVARWASGSHRTELLHRALDHAAGSVHYAALLALAGDRSPRVLLALEGALVAPRKDVVDHALRELAAMGTSQAASILVKRVEGSTFGELPGVARAAILDTLLAAHPGTVRPWVTEQRAGWAWRLSARGRERHAELDAAMRRSRSPWVMELLGGRT